MSPFRFLTFSILLQILFTGVTQGKYPNDSYQFPQISKLLNFADIENRMSWLLIQIKKNDFRLLKNIPFTGALILKNSNEYEYLMRLEYTKKGKQLFPELVFISKRKPPRGIFVQITFYPTSDKIFSYEEFVFEWTLNSTFDKDGGLSSISLFDHDGRRNMTFDKNKNVIKNDFIEHSDDIKQQIQKTKNELMVIGKDNSNFLEPAIKSEYRIQVPKSIKDTDVLKKINNISMCYLAIAEGKTVQILNNAIFDFVDPKMTLYLFYSTDFISFVAIECSKNAHDFGCFFVFNEQLQLQKYVEGDIKFDENQTGSEIAKTAFIPDKGSSTEIYFHPSGYPSSYHTIVKGRLFGRQIEWNDKGEVISDVDLDIPKPWADVPKKATETEK
jgi:hypothetical protein